jgi:hydroxymethylpyrimidine pyrophosphatase-like HAD family hydrolase
MEAVRADFERLSPGLSLIYSTSPMGDAALWLEIFPPGVSKGAAASRLAGSLGLSASDCLAIGNDYNDIDLLAWAGSAFLTADAAEALRPLYRPAPPSTAAPLAWLVERMAPREGPAETP